MEIYTIGFTKKSAERFFAALKDAKIKTLLDVRLNNSSQLAGFSKSEDLAFFLDAIGHIAYKHELLLAPTASMLGDYKKRGGDWPAYERQFLKLMQDRQIDIKLRKADFANRTALLCSEATAEHCHRRLVAEYLSRQWGGITITHL